MNLNPNTEIKFSDELPQFGQDVDVAKSKLSKKISTKTRDEWMLIFDKDPGILSVLRRFLQTVKNTQP